MGKVTRATLHPGRRFIDYAVLVVVIADESVAKVYEAALGELQVDISYHLSRIFDSGAAAKRFRTIGG